MQLARQAGRPDHGSLVPLRTITVAERRARLVRRHHLGPKSGATDVATAVRDLVAVHSTDPASVFIGLAQRVKDADVATIEHALYEAKSVVRMLGMRRTVHVVPLDLVQVVHSSSTRAVAARERKRWLDQLTASGLVSDPQRWLKQAEDDTLRALAARGEATANELVKDVPALQLRIPVGEGKKWAGELSASTHVLGLLAADGLAVRGRPRGTWISTQYRWAPMSAWLSKPIDEDEPPGPVARAQLVERWLASYGPGTLQDIKWWTGWTVAETRRALADAGAIEVDLDGQPGLVSPGDDAAVRMPPPFAVLLPGLDTTVMGWQQRSWFLGPHGPSLFDRSGNAGPTVWWDGRVVGGWVQRKDGAVVYRLLEDVGADAVRAIDAAAARLQSWLGSTRITPRFRTPVERELSS